MSDMKPVTQAWTHSLPMMQQTVLLTAIRGPDGIEKYGSVKMLLRWYRRCVLHSAMDGKTLDTPYLLNGGSFTGPSFAPGELHNTGWESNLDDIVSGYMRTLDAIPHHFQIHFMHAVEILGYKHPDGRTRNWWHALYRRLVNDLHLHPETEPEMSARLGDSREGWIQRADKATIE